MPIGRQDGTHQGTCCCAAGQARMAQNQTWQKGADQSASGLRPLDMYAMDCCHGLLLYAMHLLLAVV